MKRPRPMAIAAVLALSCGLAAAQEEFRLDLFNPRLDLIGEGIPSREFDEQDEPSLAGQEFRMSTYGLAANIPLGPTSIRSEGKVLGWQVFLNAQAETSSTEITFLQDDPQLYQGALRLTSVFLSRGGNLYVGSLGASFAEEEESLDDLEPRFSGIGVGTYRKSDSFAFIYGGVFTYQYGRGIPFPVFGVHWRINERWSLQALAPLTARFTYKTSDRWKLGLLLTPSGNRYRFANADGEVFAGQPDEVFLRIVGVRLGAEIELVAGDHVTFAGQAGVLGGRRIRFSDDDDNDFLDARLDPAGYARAFVRFRFGKSLVEKLES